MVEIAMRPHNLENNSADNALPKPECSFCQKKTLNISSESGSGIAISKNKISSSHLIMVFTDADTPTVFAAYCILYDCMQILKKSSAKTLNIVIRSNLVKALFSTSL